MSRGEMKIFFGVHHYPPDAAGGVEIITERQARWLAGRGHEVEVVCVGRIDAPEPLSSRTEIRDGVTVHRLDLSLAGRDLHLGLRYRDPAIADWFRALLQRSPPDLFHSHSSYLISASLLEVAQQRGIPTVITLHDSWHICPRINLLHPDGTRCSGRVTPVDCAHCLLGERRRYRATGAAFRHVSRWLPVHETADRLVTWPFSARLRPVITDRHSYLDDRLRQADCVISIGRYVRDLLLERGFPPSRIRLIPTGHDFSDWVGLPRSEGSGLRFGYLGQIAPHKGVHLLVNAFRGLTAKRASTLTIHGDLSRVPDYADRLRRLADGCPAIRFTGIYENSQVERILAEVDVLVVPSVCFETRPLVVIEAFAAGVPVIASDLPNLRYQVSDGVDGLLFRPDDPAHLAAQMQRLIDAPAELDVLRRGIAPVRRLSDEMAEVESLYRALVETNLTPKLAAASA